MDNNSTNSLHGQVIIGTLILQVCSIGLIFQVLDKHFTSKRTIFHNNEPEILFDFFVADEAQTATVAEFVKSNLTSLHDSKTTPRFDGDVP